MCDVPVCLIGYGPDGELITWPENRPEVKELVPKYKKSTSNSEKRNEYDLESFLKTKKRTLGQDNGRIAGDRWPTSDKRLDGLGNFDLVDLMVQLDSKLQSLTQRRDHLIKSTAVPLNFMFAKPARE